jgi:hypothetical protein
MFSSRTDRRILLAVVAGLLVGFLPLLFLRTESAAATVRAGFEDRMVASLGGRPMRRAFIPDERMLILASQLPPRGEFVALMAPHRLRFAADDLLSATKEDKHKLRKPTSPIPGGMTSWEIGQSTTWS